MNGNDLIEEAMNTQRSVASFMLRFTQDLWQDENGDPKVQWRGRINHVQGDEEIPFTDFTEALTFIQKQMQELTLKAFPAADPGTQEKALTESFKLWEQFTANIGSQVSDAFAKTFSLWFPPAFRGPAGAEQKAGTAVEPELSPEIAAQIESLTQQVKALSEKIEALEK